MLCQAGLSVYVATFLGDDNTTCAPMGMEVVCMGVFVATMYGNATFMWTAELCLHSAYMKRETSDGSCQYFHCSSSSGFRRAIVTVLVPLTEFLIWGLLMVTG